MSGTSDKVQAPLFLYPHGRWNLLEQEPLVVWSLGHDIPTKNSYVWISHMESCNTANKRVLRLLLERTVFILDKTWKL